jgi:hypothetical protein
MSLGSALASTIASSKLSSSDSVRLRFAMTHMFRFFFAAASAAVPPSICLSSSSLASSNLASFWPRSAAERPRTFGSGSSPPHRPVKRQQIDRSRFMRSSSNGETVDASRQCHWTSTKQRGSTSVINHKSRSLDRLCKFIACANSNKGKKSLLLHGIHWVKRHNAATDS